jgi:hypothetical protein
VTGSEEVADGGDFVGGKYFHINIIYDIFINSEKS